MSLNNANVHGADELLAKLQAAKHYLENDVYEVVGIEAVKHFKQNFQEEGFVDKGVNKWAARTTKRTGSTNSQKVLSKTSELSESIDYSVAKPSVIIKTDKPYAQIHNEGGEIVVTSKMKKYFWAMHHQAKEAGDTDLADHWKGMALAKKIVMPKRQFIGDSEDLNNKIEAKIERDLTKILKR